MSKSTITVLNHKTYKATKIERIVKNINISQFGTKLGTINYKGEIVDIHMDQYGDWILDL